MTKISRSFAFLALAAGAYAAPTPYCTYYGRVPDEFKDMVEAFDAGRARISQGPEQSDPVACSSNVQTTFASFGPEGTCGDMLEFDAALEACCGGVVEENDRTITAELDFSSMTRPIIGAEFEIVITEENQDCCDDCTCWGDPHCRPFGSTALSDIKSFVLCDTSVVTENNDDGTVTCSNRLENSNAAKKRCLGTAPGYEVNAGQCLWKGDDESYDVTLDGGPCSPIDPMPLLMFGMPFPTNPTGRRLEDGVFPDGYEVFGYVGERGVIERAKVVIRKTTDSTQMTETLELDVKGNCGAIENLAKRPDAANNALKTLYDDDFFLVSRNMASQVSTNAEGETEAIIDLVWVFQDKTTLDTFKLNCRGATDPNNRSDMSSSFRQEIDDLSDADKERVGLPTEPTFLSASLFNAVGIDSQGTVRDSSSTRPAKQTIIDAQFIRSRIDRNTGARRRLDGYGSGFCFTGVFSEYSEIFGEPQSPYERCPVNENMDYADREAIRATLDCAAVMEANNCENFIDSPVGAGFEQQPEKRRFRNYRRNIDICAKIYCSKANLPPFMDVQQCYTSIIDFGAPYTMNQYSGETQYAEIDQEDCVESYCVSYNTDQGIQTQCFDIDNLDKLVFTGTPTQVVFTHHDCAGVCGTRAKIDFHAKFNTGCSELEGYECHPSGSKDCYDAGTKDCYDAGTKDCYDAGTKDCYDAGTKVCYDAASVCTDVLVDCPAP